MECQYKGIFSNDDRMKNSQGHPSLLEEQSLIFVPTILPKRTIWFHNKNPWAVMTTNKPPRQEYDVISEKLLEMSAFSELQSHLLKNMLSAVDESQEKTLIDAVSALMIFCKSDDLKAQAVSDGALHPVLSLCEMKEHIALLAIMTLSLIVEHQANLAALVEDGKGSLQKIVTLTSAKDEKMQEIAFKILASLSLGTDWQRHRIVQENYVNNKCFVEAIRRKPKNQQVLVNAACLIGNLSTCEQDQSSLRECLEAICTLVTSHPQQKDIQLQVSRAIANFSKYQVNCIALVNHLSDFIAVHLKSNVAEIRTHAVRSIIHLLSHAKEEVLTVLRRNGLEDLLSILIDVNGITDAIQNVLLQSVKERNRPMSL
eukprot:gene13554-4444_t